MTDIEDRLRQLLMAEGARTQPGMLRTLPDPAAPRARRSPASGPGRTGGAGRLWGPARLGRPRARRWLAPAGAALAVLMVIAGVSLVGMRGTPAGPAAPSGTAAMPPFYVSLVLYPRAKAEVHDSRTGHVLSSIALPKAEQGDVPRASGLISAAADGRTFAISALENTGHQTSDSRLLLLHVSADGRAEHLTVTPVHLSRPGLRPFVVGIALSPDGSKLAAAIQVPSQRPFHPHAEVKVISLRGDYRVRTWTTRQQYAIASDPAWVADGRHLGFTWEGHITGPALTEAGVTQVRLLDTTAPGGNILASTVLAEGGHGLGFILDGLLAPDGRSVLATVFRNVPGGGPGQGTAVLKLAQLSASSGQVARVFRVRSVPYEGATGENTADISCRVLSVSAGGQHALVTCPGYGRLDGARITPLPGVGIFPMVAW